MINDITVKNIHNKTVTIRANLEFIIISNEMIMNTIPNTTKLLGFMVYTFLHIKAL